MTVWSEGGAAAFLWGEAISGPGGQQIGARELAGRWSGSAPDQAEPCDGYYAAVVVRPGTGLLAGADLLGLFPVYYAATRDAVLVASSPELFALHPLFPVKPSLQGLVGILLTGGPFDGQTLLQDVTRLSPGHLLSWCRGHGAREVPQYTLPASDALARAPLPEQTEALHAAVAAAVRRHAPPGVRTGLLLSGGRDSRMLAGYLDRQKTPVRSLTLGIPDDYDFRCAMRVAVALELEHRVATIPDASFQEAAALQARWEHLCAGFSNVHMWGAVEHLQALPPRLVTGYVIDATVGGVGLASGTTPHGLTIPFEVYFAADGRRGVRPDRLRKLLRRDLFGDLVTETVARIQHQYEADVSIEPQRPWRFRLAHGERFHTGAVLWRLSFGSWPVAAILDQQLLSTLGALPATSLANRRLQDEILRLQFPHLARLPLDRNSDDLSPLAASPSARLWHHLARHARLLRRQWPGARPRERRYFYRIFDFNGPGWRAIRGAAEGQRQRLEGLFDMDELGRFLPPPGTTVRFADAILDASGPKLVLGLILWLARHER